MARTHCLVLDLEHLPPRRCRRGRKPACVPYFVVTRIRLIPLKKVIDEFGSCEQDGDDEAFSTRLQSRIDVIKAPRRGYCETMAILKFLSDPVGPFFASVFDGLYPPRAWDEVKDWKERLFSLDPY